MSDICDSEKHFYNWWVTNSFQSIGRWSGDAPSARNSNSSLSRQPTNLFHNLYFHASKREICDIFGSFVHDSWHVVVQTEESFLLQTTTCLLYFDSQWLAVCIRIPCQIDGSQPGSKSFICFSNFQRKYRIFNDFCEGDNFVVVKLGRGCRTRSSQNTGIA